jgi:hypothetical protein
MSGNEARTFSHYKLELIKRLEGDPRSYLEVCIRNDVSEASLDNKGVYGDCRHVTTTTSPTHRANLHE